MCWNWVYKLSQQSFTWNRIVNWIRHHQCPIFPGEWVSQSGALKDLGNRFWVPAVKLTASLTTGALPYQKLHIYYFCHPNGEKEKNMYAIPSLVDTQIGTCVSTLGGCIHMHSIQHLSFCIREFDCPMVCRVVTPEFGVFCLFCLCFKLMTTIIGGDFTHSWLSLPLSHGTKVKGGKIHFGGNHCASVFSMGMGQNVVISTYQYHQTWDVVPLKINS